MVRPLLTYLTLSTLIVSGIGGCDLPNRTAEVFTGREIPAAKAQPLKSSSLTAWEQSAYRQINQYRQSRNLPPLQLDSRIVEQARAHSREMANGQVPFGHQGFEQRVKAIALAIPYQMAAENVAYNQGYSDPATQAVQGWIKSTGHRINIEGQYDLTGMGVAKNAKGEYYFTQIFIRRS